jgi:N-acyl-L-homoserine lactone synthetase
MLRIVPSADRPGSTAAPSRETNSFAEAILAFEEEFAVELVNTPEIAQEAFRLRHQVYCLERGYEPDRGGVEVDEFDANARPVLLRRRSTGEVVGTVRLVLFSPGAVESSFPMQRVCEAPLLSDLPLSTTAEVSRFAISKQRRGANRAGDALMRLALIRGLVQVSYEIGITHWCAVMERTLLRLLQSSGIHFQPLGPLVEYHGLRQPSAGNLDAILDRMKREQPTIWHFVTAGGSFSNRTPVPLAA